jgi:hypothetical protein
MFVKNTPVVNLDLFCTQVFSLYAVGTGPTRWILLFQDLLAWSALALMLTAAYTGSTLVTVMAGLVLGMSTR